MNTYDVASIRKQDDQSLKRQHAAQQVPLTGLPDVLAETLRAAFKFHFGVEVTTR